MKVIPTTLSIADYCEQFIEGRITVNRDYQRGNRIWPPSARSFLIDTIIIGYPIPKILLREVTDLKTKKTRREVIDGQQRTEAIVEFFSDRLTISLKESPHYGRRFSTLDDEGKLAFLGYAISADLFVNTTDQNVREVFRRINSYTVPLNRQESRHARHQGAFKWFILSLTNEYAQSLKELGVLTERQINRMADAEFLTEIVAAMVEGIQTSSPSRLDKIYSQFDQALPFEEGLRTSLDLGFGEAFKFRESIIGTPLASRNSFYSLVLAFANARRPIDTLTSLMPANVNSLLENSEMARYNLSLLAAAATDRDDTEEFLEEFVRAQQSATNTQSNRQIKFQWFTRALSNKPLA